MRPRGYSNGIVVPAGGKLIFVAGQIGWDPVTQQIVGDDFVAQTRQALQNVVTILAEAGAKPANIVRMTWYVLDKREYAAAASHLGRAYREVLGDHYPAMTLIEVQSLLEDRARVEIEATAAIS
ncbi:MAG: RidA family protein [Candidatus Eremiobacteraeota bacterium]|nr:RidA family protein [Candidatus Eremiobacteraeota bacterium]